MRLICLATNSENCYALIHEGKALLLDAGVSASKIVFELHKAGFDDVYKNIVGCLVTHSHGDHCKGVAKLVKNGVDCFGPVEVEDVIIVEPYKLYDFIDFNVKVIPVPHDVRCFAYSIEFGGKKILYATDLAYFPPTAGLPNYDLILIENNWTDLGMQESDLAYPVKIRIKGSHMREETLRRILLDDKLISYRKCLFVHMSPRNHKYMIKWDNRHQVIEAGKSYEF